MKELLKALVKAKGSFSRIEKDQSNPHFKTTYASLDSVLDAVTPALQANGLLIVHRIERADDVLNLVTTLFHAESGESIDTIYPLNPQQNDQQRGSSISYGRRYSVCALLSVVADEDDDGEGSKPSPKKTQPQPQSQPASLSNAARINEAKKQYGISDEDSRAIGAALFPGRKPGDLTEQEVSRFIDEFKPISQAGIKTLMGAAASIGMGDPQVKELISQWWGYTSKKQIKVYQLRQITAWVESQKENSAPLAPREAPMTVAGVAIE